MAGLLDSEVFSGEMQIKFAHGHQQGSQGYDIADGAAQGAHIQIVNTPENAGGQGDKPQQALIFHAIGDGGQQLSGNEHNADRTVKGNNTHNHHKCTENINEPLGGAASFYHSAKQQIPDGRGKIQQGSRPGTQQKVLHREDQFRGHLAQHNVIVFLKLKGQRTGSQAQKSDQLNKHNGHLVSENIVLPWERKHYNILSKHLQDVCNKYAKDW